MFMFHSMHVFVLFKCYKFAFAVKSLFNLLIFTICNFWPALCGIALSNAPALCNIALKNCPALCGIALDHFVLNSAFLISAMRHIAKQLSSAMRA
jgi:hypothetical protein